MSNALTTELREGGVAIVTFDLVGESVNKLTRGVLEEFKTLMDRVDSDTTIRAVVLFSGKPDLFIAGADIDGFLELRTAAEAEALSREGQELMNRIEKLRAPVVFAIHGACVGGGLEASLAAAYRIASDHPKTVLALPEVQLGLIPGAGGTQRLPQRVGLRQSLGMILQGKNVRAKKALQIGLIDELVHPSILLEIAVDRAAKLADGKIARERGRAVHGLSDVVLEDNALGRSVVFRKAREATRKATKGNYPAPLAAIDAIEQSYMGDRAKGFATEARLFGEMAVTDVSRQLIFLFFATAALKKDTGVGGAKVQPLLVEKIGILGAGFMGAGIAAIAAMQGTVVRLKDAQHERVGKGLKEVASILRESLKRKRITKRQLDDQLTLVGGTIDYSGFSDASIVIEAVFEDLKVKQSVLAEAEAAAPRAIFASNTSTIPIEQIAANAKHPERVVGMHFFSPVQKMPLLEVIRAKRTGDEALATAVSYGKKLGKTVIVVQDAPGFYANRILAPYVNEAGLLLDEGVAVDAIDKALVEFGFPVGPITLIDEVGLDIAGKSSAVMIGAFGDRLIPAQSLAKVIEAGRTGRKGGKGFYRYEGGKKKGVDETVYPLFSSTGQRMLIGARDIVERCVFAMLNEAARCLEEGIIASSRDGDIGAVFGIGFPPFRGGPFRYLDTLGIPTVIRALEVLDGRFSPRFHPAQILREMAASGAHFYPEREKPH
ncbi:MAG: fatty acid oxidation complex subunit alpha FadJ [Gemmatimonadota bacterium]|nr:fatty acid oxidation complex subunit alpha FadJ [Gemmatimonadota bacterium]